MNNSINTSWINQTNTKIFVLPALNRDKDNDFNKEDIVLTWYVAKFTETQFLIQLNFSKPAYISPKSW